MIGGDSTRAERPPMNQVTTDFETTLLSCVREGFESALEFRKSDRSIQLLEEQKSDKRKLRVRNKLFSSVFVSEISSKIRCKLANLFPGENNLECQFIEVKAGKRQPGEWLLDMCVVQTEEFESEYKFGPQSPVPVIEKLLFAMESEANTSARAFAEDFAKLLVVNSAHKLYLNGVDQREPGDLDRYIEARNKMASNILRRNNESGLFYMGYWPSPGKPSWKAGSLWDSLEDYKHLRKIRFYRYKNGGMEALAEFHSRGAGSSVPVWIATL